MEQSYSVLALLTMNDPEENSAESVTDYPSKSITETSGESRPILDCGAIVEPDNAVADCPVTSGDSIKEVRSLQPHVTQVRTSLSLCAFIASSPVRFHLQQVLCTLQCKPAWDWNISQCSWSFMHMQCLQCHYNVCNGIWVQERVPKLGGTVVLPLIFKMPVNLSTTPWQFLHFFDQF